MKKIILLGMLISIGVSSRAQNSWVQKSSPPITIRICPYSFSSGQSGYVTTGFDTNFHVLFDSWKYDQPGNTWSQQTNINFASKSCGSSFTVAGRSFCGFGYLSNGAVTNDLWEIDTSTGAWSQKTSCPGPARALANSFVINDKAYVVCGTRNSSNSIYLSDCWEYDVATNAWTAKADYPGMQRVWPVSFVVDGLAYVGTGMNVNDSLLTDFYSYNNVADTWTPISNFPSGRVGGVGFALHNTGYVGFGDNGNIKCNDLWYYEKNTDSWQIAASLPGAGRDQPYSFLINDKFYVGGGQDDNAHYFNDLWEYSPDTTLDVAGIKFPSDISVMNRGNEITVSASVVVLPLKLNVFNAAGQMILNTIVASENQTYPDAELRDSPLLYELTDCRGREYKGRVKVSR
jgi:hypothetical protein